MAPRWREPAAFRPASTAAAGPRPSRAQAIALLAVIALVGAGAAVASWLLAPSKAQAFNLFGGSVYINDVRAPVAVDLATGKPTVRLRQANDQVGTTDSSALIVYPLDGGTLLLNGATGEFNMVDSTGFVIKLTGGVPLPPRAGARSAIGVASGSNAYIVRTGGGRTDAYLVGPATVQAAAQPGAKVNPRAYRTIGGDLVSGDGTAATANGDLWLLASTGGHERLLHLAVPPASGNGARLTAHAEGVPTGTAIGVVATGTAPATATALGSARTEQDVVAVASADAVRLIQPDGTTRVYPFAPIPGLDRLAPATNQHDVAQFLFHGTQGWGLLRIGADGTGLTRTMLAGVDASADLADPAASSGRLYTIDRSTGRILSVDASGRASTVGRYTVVPGIESSVFSDAYLIARGARVIVDSPNHILAFAIFTDEPSAAPHEINKNAAVNVNASGGAEAIARAHAAPVPHPGRVPPPSQSPPNAPVPAPVQPINNNIDCRTTTQQPHIPAFSVIEPGSRSVHLEWVYPKVDAQDCVPSTYTIDVALISVDAPPAPGQVRVQGQTAVNLVGLFPSTQYRLTLTAYLNGRAARAPATVVTTGPEGPAAPTGVTVAATDTGDWTVSWQSCGGIKNSCVPSATWDVLPSLCDGRGLSGALTPLSVIGDPTLRTFSVTYPGGVLLGRSLRFQIQGRGDTGAVGTPSAASACVQSWSPPVVTGVTLTASQPATTTVGGTSTTTVTVNLGRSAQQAVGGIGGGVRFQLTGPDGTTVKGPLPYDGKTSILSTTFDGVRPGATYSATAFLVPPGHPEAAAQLDTVPVTTSAAWPADLAIAAADCSPNDGSIKLSCDLTVRIGGLASADARDEMFDLTDQSRLQCGERAQPLSKSAFDPGTDTVTATVSLLQYSGSCTVFAQLVESAGDAPPLVLGGTVSPMLTRDVVLGQPTTLDADAGDFAVSWSGPPGSHVNVQYTGRYTDAQVNAMTQNWQETVLAPDGSACGGDNRQPTHAGITVDPSAGCINGQGGQSGWRVQISYDDAGTATTHTVTENLDGTPPGYVPCTVDPTAFDGTWAGTQANPAAQLTFGGNESDLASCSGWAYSLRTPDDTPCGSGPSGQAPDTASPVTIAATCSTPPGDSWRIRVTYQRPDGAPQSFDVVVTGPVPP